MSRECRCLSIQQPHADFIIFGEKWCENRSWRTHYRGELWIHTSSRWDKWMRTYYEELGIDLVELSPGGCRTGAVIGRTQLIDCVPAEDLELWRDGEVDLADVSESTAEFLSGKSETSWEYCFGPWCWILAEPEALAEPVEMGGKLGLWKLGVEAPRLKLKRPAVRS